MTILRNPYSCERAGKRAMVFAVIVGLLSVRAFATEYDLSAAGTQSFNVLGDFGGTAIFSDYWSQPTGTGVFDPFLSLDSNGQTSTNNTNIEQAYNSDGHNALYLDGHRPSWNTSLHVGDLATIKLNNVNYYGFVLDANEPGNAQSTLSIDNIRIYTSSTDNTASVQNDINNLNNLGTLRWALNDPTKTGNQFNITDWIKLDANQENVGVGKSNANGGSGMADMIVYIPQAAFGNAGANDFVWFYNLDGVHYSADKNLAATAGFEEWSAVASIAPPSVPDGGMTAVLIGLGLICSGLAARRWGSAKS